MKNKKQTVVVLGASPNPDRYSNKAVKMLITFGYDVIPIHPKLKEIEGLPVVSMLSNVKKKVDTLTVYVGPQKSKTLIDSIISLNPGRVILNPGTESLELENSLFQNNIPFIKGCTLVMLRTKQF
jgi:predicted CoA-binding protein